MVGVWIFISRVLGSKSLDSSKVGSAFHLSEASQMRARNSWGRSGKK